MTAKQRERAAVDELRHAADVVFRASAKFRADSTATHLSGQLEAARMIIERVADKVDSRTK
jgi:hypothetical protein